MAGWMPWIAPRMNGRDDHPDGAGWFAGVVHGVRCPLGCGEAGTCPGPSPPGAVSGRVCGPDSRSRRATVHRRDRRGCAGTGRPPMRQQLNAPGAACKSLRQRLWVWLRVRHWLRLRFRFRRWQWPRLRPGFRWRRWRHRRRHWRWHRRRLHRFGPRRLRLRGLRLRCLTSIWSGVWRHLAGPFVGGHHGLTGTICGHPEMIPRRALCPPRGGRLVSTSRALTCARPCAPDPGDLSRRQIGRRIGVAAAGGDRRQAAALHGPGRVSPARRDPSHRRRARHPAPPLPRRRRSDDPGPTGPVITQGHLNTSRKTADHPKNVSSLFLIHGDADGTARPHALSSRPTRDITRQSARSPRQSRGVRDKYLFGVRRACQC